MLNKDAGGVLTCLLIKHEDQLFRPVSEEWFSHSPQNQGRPKAVIYV